MPKKGKSVSSTELIFFCKDGKIVHLDPICRWESETIRGYFSRDDKPLFHRFGSDTNIPSNILEMVNDFCISRFEIFNAYADDDNLFSDMLEDFEVKFLKKKPLSLLVQLIRAAYELRIRSLLDLTCNAIDDVIYRKFANEILNEMGNSVSLTKLVNDNFPKKAMFRFLCVDGKIVHVDPRCNYESEKIHKLLGDRIVRKVHSPMKAQIPSNILSIVNDFCISRYLIFIAWKDCEGFCIDYDLLVDKLEDFDVKFIQQQAPPVLVQLICAAYELRITSLLDMMCYAIEDMFYRKFANEFLKEKGKSKSILKKGKSVSLTKLVDVKFSKKVMFRFLCMDGKIVHVDPICCYESKKIRQLLSGDIGLSLIKAQIPSNILSLVNDFCISRFEIKKTYAYHDDNLLVDMLEHFNVKFIQQQEPPVLVQLQCAAYELEIRSLLDMICNAIGDVLRGISTNESLKKKGKSVLTMPKDEKSVSLPKQVAGNLSNKAMLRFQCMNGKIVQMDPICCYESGKICRLLTERLEYMSRIPIKSQIPSKILSTVNHFCVSRFKISKDFAHLDDNSLLNKLVDFEVQFIRHQTLSDIAQLICAAYELRIQSLLELMFYAINYMHHGKCTNEILKKKRKSVSSTMLKKGESVSSTKLVDGNLSNKAMLRFHCMDGKIVHVDPICRWESEKIRQLLTDEETNEKPGDIGRFPIMAQIPSNILSMVNDFCISRFEIMKNYVHHDDNILVDMLMDFNLKFIQQPKPVLVQLKCAAYGLRIQSLFDLTRNAIVDKIDGNSSDKAVLRFCCVDGKIVDVDPRCCYESDYFRQKLIETEENEKDKWMVDEGDIGRICIPTQIPNNILSMANKFCISRLEIVNACAGDDNCLSDLLGDFDCRFVQKQPLTLLVQLMHAAYKLRIQSLLDLTRNAIVDEINGKSAKEILKIFNMPDFTHNVWTRPFASEPWGHKRMIF